MSNTEWQERVRKERDELSDKLVKLREFRLWSGKFAELPLVQQHLLHEQERYMSEYLHILDCRISLF